MLTEKEMERLETAWEEGHCAGRNEWKNLIISIIKGGCSQNEKSTLVKLLNTMKKYSKQ